MPYSPKFLYKTYDHAGCLWNVRAERPTSHGWLLLLGRLAVPLDEDKNGSGGDQVIITHELTAYMNAMRMTPGTIDLPVCTATITRLRRVLGLNFKADRAKWWDERFYDLTAERKDIAEIYEVSIATAARHSKARGIVRAHSRWSQDEKALLQRLLRENLSLNEIASKMGKTRGAIKIMRYKLVGKISNNRPWSEEEKAEALRLLADGVKIKDVASSLGRTKQSLFAMRSRAIGAVSPRKQHRQDEEKARLIDMVESGYDDLQIADAPQRSKYTVRDMRQKLLPLF